MRRAFIVAVFAAIALMVTLGIARGVVPGPGGQQVVAQGEATRFAGRAVVLAPARADGSINQYLDTATGDSYGFDSRGTLRGFADKRALAALDSAAASASPVLPDEALVAAARQFVASRFPGTGAETMTASLSRNLVSVDTYGNRRWDYMVEMRSTVGGVPSCNWVHVHLNPVTGEVALLARDDGPVSISTTPGVSKDDAIAAVARQAVMTAGFSTDFCTLEIIRDTSGATPSPKLVWHVQIHTGSRPGEGSGARAYVDARTGQVTQFAVADR